MAYKKRAVWKSFHRRTARYAFVFKHRRAGASLAAIGDLVERAKASRTAGAQFALIVPKTAQLRLNVSYALSVAEGDPSIRVLKDERRLIVSRKHGGEATIDFYGADDLGPLRGRDLDGVVLDEAEAMSADVMTFIEPLLEARKGWYAILTSYPDLNTATPHWTKRLFDVALNNLACWYVQVIAASQSQIIGLQELAELRKDMSERAYAREWECR